MKSALHFAHGNGFPSPCYRQLLSHLNERFDCYYIDRVGHSPEYPVTENWDHLVQEVIVSIQSQVNKPVLGLGHSLGGVLTLLAAIEQPELFSAVIVLDSPLIGRLKSSIVRFSKALGMIDLLTPAFRIRERRHHWNSREQLIIYLKNKNLFKTFTDECLNDYIDYGMEKNEDGYSLRFDKHIEYQIYRTIPHILSMYEGQLKVPSVVIYGSNSNIIDKLDLSYMKKKYGIDNVKTKGTHMFPMEFPEITANLIMDIADKIINPGVNAL